MTAAKLTVTAGVLFILTGSLHAIGLPWVTGLAASAPHDLMVVIPTLWLAITAAMVVLGLMVVLIGLKPAPYGRALVALTGLFPLANAILLIVGAGNSPPVYIFSAVALATFAAAWRHPAA